MPKPEKSGSPAQAATESESSLLEGADALQLYLVTIRRNCADISSQFDKLDSVLRKRRAIETEPAGEPPTDAGAGGERGEKSAS